MLQIVGNVCFILGNDVYLEDIDLKDIDFSEEVDVVFSKMIQEKIRQGYSVVSAIKRDDQYLDEEEDSIQVYIPKKVSEEQMENTILYYNQVFQTHSTYEFYITNYFQDQYGDDYDWYDYYFINKKSRNDSPLIQLEMVRRWIDIQK